MQLDPIDQHMLRLLQEDGRMSNADLAQKVGLSPSACLRRLHLLEKRGVIRGYTALVDAEAAGYPLMAFIAVTLGSLKGNFRGREEFLDMIQAMDEVKECHHLAGSDDFLLKVRCHGTEDLERIIIERLRALPIITHTRTTVVLGTTKEMPSMVSARRDKPRAKRKG